MILNWAYTAQFSPFLLQYLTGTTPFRVGMTFRRYPCGAQKLKLRRLSATDLSLEDQMNFHHV